MHMETKLIYLSLLTPAPILISIAGFACTLAIESLPRMLPKLQKFLLDSSILKNIILFKIAGGFWAGLKQSKGELEIRSIW